jgi:RNA polymerase-binding transcription factor DksA
MADNADLAAERIELEHALTMRARRKPVPSSICHDCGEEVPPHRVEFGMCLECAEERERAKRHGGVE